MQHISAVAGGIKIKGRPVRFDDFMPKDPKKKHDSHDEELAHARASAALIRSEAAKKRESKK